MVLSESDISRVTLLLVCRYIMEGGNPELSASGLQISPIAFTIAMIASSNSNFYDNLVNICVFVLRKARKTLKYSFVYVF